MTTMTPTTTPKDQQITSLQAILRDPTKRAELLSDDDKCAKLCEADHLRPIIEAAILEADTADTADATEPQTIPAETPAETPEERIERKARKKAKKAAKKKAKAAVESAAVESAATPTPKPTPKRKPAPTVTYRVRLVKSGSTGKIMRGLNSFRAGGKPFRASVHTIALETLHDGVVFTRSMHGSAEGAAWFAVASQSADLAKLEHRLG